MAYFARIENGAVAQVIVVNDADAPDEPTGQSFIASIGLDGEWVETAIDGSVRGKYAGPGDRYDGAHFTTPPVVDATSAAYERGKADGAAEAMTSMKAEQVI